METEALAKSLTLEEKASLCVGMNFWMTKGFPEKGIKSLFLSDGPHGLRKQSVDNADHLGLNESNISVCFPTGSALACSWNRETLSKVGSALGISAKMAGIDMLLGPAINIKRSPLCGRNFEYYSEDPFLTGELAVAFIKALQKHNVSACPKHFAANNQETRRKAINSIIDERTLREIYLFAFEKCIKDGKSQGIMTSYNKINGTYVSENIEITDNILRKEWNFKGTVVSDWGAIDQIVDSLKAGLSLQMPGNDGSSIRKIVDAVNTGKLPESILDQRVESLLRTIKFVTTREENPEEITSDEIHGIALNAAIDSIVLLKNEHNILPLRKSEKIGIIGQMAKHPRYQGGGSSHVNPYKVSNAYDELQKFFSYTIPYADGYNGETTTNEYIQEAINIAENVEKVLIFIGLPETYESETYDRVSINLPEGYNELVKKVVSVNKNTSVVLSNGSSITFPWKDVVPSIVEAYLTGESSGEAIAQILTGQQNPSGKLAETFIEKIEDSPSFLNFPGNGHDVEYKEGIFVGYRYYDKKKIKTLFPFGHGLSYTKFEYSNLKIINRCISNIENAEVSVDIKNIGDLPGKEVIQVYIAPPSDYPVIRPDKELKEFAKIELEPNQVKTVSFILPYNSFAYYEKALHDWYVPSGEYTILIGSSCEDIRLRDTITIRNDIPLCYAIGRNTLLGDILSDKELTSIFDETYKRIKPYLPFGLDKGDLSSPISQSLLRNMTLNSLAGYVGNHLTDQDIEDLSAAMNENLASRTQLVRY